VADRIAFLLLQQHGGLNKRALPAWRYDSAVLAVARCLSVTSGVASKRMDGSSWIFAARLLFTNPTPCFKEIRVSTKLQNFLRNFEPNFARQRVVNLARQKVTFSATN